MPRRFFFFVLPYTAGASFIFLVLVCGALHELAVEAVPARVSNLVLCTHTPLWGHTEVAKWEVGGSCDIGLVILSL
jgi:hypothetical protein